MIKTLYEKFKPWSEKGSIYIISDPHFGDENMNWRADLINDYPFNKNDFGACSDELIAQYISEYIVWKVNKQVHKDDTLIILGDIGDTKYVKKLKAGYKVLIKGNHDTGTANYQRKKWRDYISMDDDYAEYVEKGILPKVICTKEDIEGKHKALDEIRYKYLDQYKGKEDYLYMSETISWTLHHSSVGYYLLEVYFDNKLFDEIYEGPLFISDKLLLSHEPIMGLEDICFNIHGHVHNASPEYLDIVYDRKWEDYYKNTAIEQINFTPVNLGELINNGKLKKISGIHRVTIDKATENKK